MPLPAAKRPAYRELPNGLILTPVELEIIELFRQKRSDAAMRQHMSMTQSALLGIVVVIRGKLGVGLDETVREAADRHELPRLDI